MKITDETAMAKELATHQANESSNIANYQTSVTAEDKRHSAALTALLLDDPEVVMPPATGLIINIGDGKSPLVIDGNVTKYTSGTTIVVKPGTYTTGIKIANLAGVTVIGTGVIMDGLNKSQAGFYNFLTLENLTNCTIQGFTTQNCGYYSGYINGKLNGVTIQQMTYNNCAQGFGYGVAYIWDGTDASCMVLNCKILNCTFIGAVIGGSASVSNGVITNLFKNLEIAYNTITANDAGEFLLLGAVDRLLFHDNTITNFNPTNNNDNRIIKIIGNGDAYNNKFDTIEGHAIALWPMSFGSVAVVSHFYNNTVTNSRRYAAFEMQEFTFLNIPGKTVKSDLVVSGNTVSNMNLDHWTGYPATFIDNYQGLIKGTLGSTVTLTNNNGKNWFPIPKLPIVWNLAQPSVYSGNIYSN